MGNPILLQRTLCEKVDDGIDGINLFLCSGLLLQGCLATRGWVQGQVDPVNSRVSRVEGQLSNFDSRLSQTDAKMNGIIDRLDQLKLQRKLVLNMEEGATFTFVFPVGNPAPAPLPQPPAFLRAEPVPGI